MEPHGEACEVDKEQMARRMQDLFRLLGKPHVLDILHLYTRHDDPVPLRFVDIQQALALSPNTLTARLKELVEMGFLTRTAYNEIPPRVDYAPTDKTQDMCTVFRAFGSWTFKHDLGPIQVTA